jgi:hypothetical protein
LESFYVVFYSKSSKFGELHSLLKHSVMFSRFPQQLQYEGPRPNLEMSQDFMLWKHQVRQALSRLCSLDFHRTAGATASDAGFRAALQGLYMDGHFTEFLACEAWRQAGVDEAGGHALQVLQRQLDAYDEPATDAAIMLDPEWWAIAGQAARVVTLMA